MSTFKCIGAGAALLTALLAAGCATSGSHSERSAFPAGRYQNGETVAIFSADGSFKGTTTQAEDWVKGTYTVSGDSLTMIDTWESDSLVKRMGKSCINVPGKYRWTVSKDVLVATVVDDPCDGRREGTSGVPWTRVN